MNRIGIAISGGPNPAEIVDLVVLAETLGYSLRLDRRGPWWRSVRDTGGLCDADLAHPARHQHQQRLCPHRADDRDGSVLGRRTVRRAVHSRTRVEPQGAGRTRAWRCIWEAADPHPRDRRHRPRTDPGRAVCNSMARRSASRISISGIRHGIGTCRCTCRRCSPKASLCAVRVADGIILTRSTVSTAAPVRAQLAEAARIAGRDPRQIEVTTLLSTSVGETRDAALAALRPGFAFYAGFFPRYNRMMAEHGFVDRSRGDRRGMGARRSAGRPRGQSVTR